MKLNKYRSLFAVFTLMVIGMTAYESSKQFLLPDLSLWESHAITIGFSSFIALVIGNFTLNKFEKLFALREQAELNLRRAHDELEAKVNERTRELSVSMKEAEIANRAKSEFLSSMSHELRTPMNAIMGFAQMLECNPKEPLTETQESCVSLILSGSHHLLELIDKVLELSKIEAGHMSINIDHTQVLDVIKRSLNLIRPRADKEGVEIIDQTAGRDFPSLWTDGTRLTQVLLNLLSNAVKYNRKGGTVTVTCREIPGQKLRIKVADDGPGIPEEKHDYLFRPFERLGREAGAIEGAGIGLVITRQIVEVLGGQIGFESEEGKGSTFWVDIPTSAKKIENAANMDTAKSAHNMINARGEESA